MSRLGEEQVERGDASRRREALGFEPEHHVDKRVSGTLDTGERVVIVGVAVVESDSTTINANSTVYTRTAATSESQTQQQVKQMLPW